MSDDATALAPDEPLRGSLQVIVSLINAGDFQGAAVAAGALGDSAARREAWQRIAVANANLQRFGAAVRAAECALREDPGSRVARLQHALLLERDGRDAESLEALEALVREADDSPQLIAHLVRGLQYAGRIADANSRLDAALARWPTDVPLLRLSAEIAWMSGAGADCTARIERAIAEHPEALQLRLVAADLLRSAGEPARGLALVEEAARRVPGVAAFETSIGVLLGDLGRAREALPYLRSAVARSPEAVQMRRNLLPVLLRAGEYREALALAGELLRGAPDDQQLLAYLAGAMRLAGDPRYATLQDYARLVRVYRPAPPAGYADMKSFNAALALEVTALHGERRRPLAQSIRGGSQTERNLPRDPARYPAIAAFYAMLETPIGDYVARLGAADHPTDRRRRDGWRITGSWSVRLEPGGFHTNHVHPQGWISSAYYIELPPSGSREEPRAGWLKFGELAPAIPEAGPEHHVEPAEGALVLFPSFFWHGTVPFTSGERRLTAAFDVVPD